MKVFNKRFEIVPKRKRKKKKRCTIKYRHRLQEPLVNGQVIKMYLVNVPFLYTYPMYYKYNI